MSGIADMVFVDETGFHYPDYPTVLAHMQETYRNIYGADCYLEADSQDGQWVAIIALAIFDCMQVASAVYSSFSPLTAQSDALSRNVKINGIHRRIATYSTVDLRIVGQAGTVITNGQAEDTLGQKWNLPPTVTIPLGGEIVVTATAAEIGRVQAQAGTVTKIATPTLGWQTVENPLAAVEGVDVETDAELRRRQQQSTMLPSIGPLDGLVGAVLSLTGVKRARGYENDKGSPNADGLPGHYIAVVVDGGDVQEIADTIMRKKTLGAGTHGDVECLTYDDYGVEKVIRFFRPQPCRIFVQVDLRMRAGYVASTAARIKYEIAKFIREQNIGDDVYITKLYVPACLTNEPELRDTFDVVNIRIRREGGSWTSNNVALAYIEAAECEPDNVTINLL